MILFRRKGMLYEPTPLAIPPFILTTTAVAANEGWRDDGRQRRRCREGPARLGDRFKKGQKLNPPTTLQIAQGKPQKPLYLHLQPREHEEQVHHDREDESNHLVLVVGKMHEPTARNAKGHQQTPEIAHGDDAVIRLPGDRFTDPHGEGEQESDPGKMPTRRDICRATAGKSKAGQ